MPEHLVRLRKTAGGNSVQWDGETYSWPSQDPVAEVPSALAAELLAIPGAGYSIDGDEVLHLPGTEGLAGSVQDAAHAGLAASREGAPQDVTEPAPEDGEREVTEPAPPAGHPVAEGGENTGSPVTPRPRAGTRPRAAGPRGNGRK